MKKRIATLFLLGLMTAGLTGCSRETMNAQIAESIGTLGLYENNEPVESPKMRAEREMREAKHAREEAVSTHVEKAQRLAASYDYSGALAELALIEEDYQEDESVISSKIEFQRLLSTMDTYNGDIAHFSVKSLVVDPELAFDYDDMSYTYNNWSLTVDEFQSILQQLYDNDYVLMDVHEIIVEIENDDGTVSFAVNRPNLPPDKKPVVLSFTEANYYSHGDENGFSTRMILDEDGKIKNEYVDQEGNTLIGAYDVIPIVDKFVEEHPDFSLRGAKGIVSVTGYQGAFGYGIETGAEQIKAIAETMKADGWLIACHGYGNEAMNTGMDYDTFVEEMEEWERKIGSLVGDTELIIFPYGDEVYAGDPKHDWLLEHGYQYYFGIWTTADFKEVNSDYVRQTRRTLDGYDLYYYGESMEDFFDAEKVLNKEVRMPFE